MQNLILKAIQIIQLWALENKTEIDVSDQKLRKVLSQLKIEQQLLDKNKMTGIKERVRWW